MSAKSSRPARHETKPTRAAGSTRPLISRSARATTTWVVVLLVVAVAILYREIVFEGKVFYAGDTQAAASFAAVGKDQLAAGSYPVWNPYLFGGMPSYGSLAYTPYVYPVNYVLGLLVRFLFFPDYTWFLFHTFLTGLGTFLLVRSRGAAAGAAAAAGVFMMWMPNLVAMGANGHGSQACAVAYLPLALYFWDRLWRGQGVLVNGAALAVTLGFSMLRSHLQISYYTYALVFLHLAFFGIVRVIEAVRRREPAESPLPAAFALRLRGAGPLGRAAADVGFAAVVLVVVVGLSLAMCAVLYGPVHDYAQYSIRGATAEGGVDYDYATRWSLHPSEMLTFLVPHSFGFGKELYLGHMPFTDYPNYLGVVVLGFAAVAVACVRTRWVMFAAFVAIVATLVSFGKYFGFLYDPLFDHLPYFSKFRVPVMVLIVQQLAAVALFAVGADALLRRAGGLRARRVALYALILAGGAFLVALFSQGYFSDGFVTAAAPKVKATADPDQQRMVARMVGEFLARDVLQAAAIALVVAGAAFVFATRSRVGVAAMAVVIGILGAVDFYRVDRFILHPDRLLSHDAYRVLRDPVETARYSEPDDMMDVLRAQQGPFRVFPIDDARRPLGPFFSSNRFMVFGVESVGGYHPAKLTIYAEYLQALGDALVRGNMQPLDMLNTRFLVSGAPLPEHPRFRPVWSGRDYEQSRFVYENTEAFPRAWVVGEYRVAGRDATLGALVSGEVDLKRTALLDRAPAVEPVAGDSALVEVTRRTPRELALAVELDRPGIVVVSEVYYPDWKATVDGEPVEVLRANHVLRAVAMEAGRHEILFRYDTSLLRRSAATSIAAFALTGLVLAGSFAGRWRRTRWKRSS